MPFGGQLLLGDHFTPWWSIQKVITQPQSHWKRTMVVYTIVGGTIQVTFCQYQIRYNLLLRIL